MVETMNREYAAAIKFGEENRLITMPFAALVDNRFPNEHSRVPSEGVAPKIRSRHAAQAKPRLLQRKPSKSRANWERTTLWSKRKFTPADAGRGPFTNGFKGGVHLCKSPDRSPRGRGEDAWANFGHASNGPGWTCREQSSGRGIGRDRARNLFRHPARSRDGRAADCRQHGRWRGNRNRCGEIARKNHARADRSAGGNAAISGTQTSEAITVRISDSSKRRRNCSTDFIARSSGSIARWWK